MFQKQFSGVHQRYGRDELLWETRRFQQTLGMLKRSLQKPSYVERKQYRAENISCFRDRYSDKFRKNKNTFIGINNRQNKLCGFFFFFFWQMINRNWTKHTKCHIHLFCSKTSKQVKSLSRTEDRRSILWSALRSPSPIRAQTRVRSATGYSSKQTEIT